MTRLTGADDRREMMDHKKATEIVDEVAEIMSGEYEIDCTISLTGGENCITISRGSRRVEMTAAAARRIGEQLKKETGDDGGLIFPAELIEAANK